MYQPQEKEILQSHKRSATISLDDIQVLQTGKSWLINSHSSQQYCIEKAGETCNLPSLKCTVCNICVHTFIYSCTDNIIKINICKHIHACAQQFNTAVDDTINDTHTSIVDEQKQLLDMIQAPVESKSNINKNIISKAEFIHGLCVTSDIGEEKVHLVEKKWTRLYQ